jgi:hypothetical protein
MYSLFRGELGSMKMVFGYLEGITLFFKELLCNLSILELCSTLIFCTWCVLMLFFYILSILDHNIWYQSSRSWGFVDAYETPWNFSYNFFSTLFQKEPLGGYLLDESRYVEFKFQLLRPYNFGAIACVI